LVEFVTVAVNCWVAEVGADAVAGDTDTDTAVTTVAVALALCVASVWLVAVILTLAGDGGLAGAV
jgi:hypothetical protein